VWFSIEEKRITEMRKLIKNFNNYLALTIGSDADEEGDELS